MVRVCFVNQNQVRYVRLRKTGGKCSLAVNLERMYLKSHVGCGWISTVDDFPQQRSHTRTGASPQPRSGTGFLLVEHASQTPPPQARQWCLVSPSANKWRHTWQAWKIKKKYELKRTKKSRAWTLSTLIWATTTWPPFLGFCWIKIGENHERKAELNRIADKKN